MGLELSFSIVAVVSAIGALLSSWLFDPHAEKIKTEIGNIAFIEQVRNDFIFGSWLFVY